MKRKAIIDRIWNDHPPKHELMVRFGDCRIHVAADIEDIRDSLAGYFEPFVVSEGDEPDIRITAHEAPSPDFPVQYTPWAREPGKNLKEEFVDLEDCRIVHKVKTGMVFVFGNEDNVAVGPCMDNLNQVINFINTRFIQRKLCRGCLLGHAAALNRNGNGMAFAGFAGAGKSTLALKIMNFGPNFVSNDRLLIEKQAQGLTMYGVAKLPRINPGTALNNARLSDVIPPEEKESFSDLPTDKLWDLEHKYDVFIDRCFGPDRFMLNSPMNHLVILNWKRDGQNPPRIDKIDFAQRQDLLPAFMKSAGVFFTPYGDCRPLASIEPDYIDFLSRITSWVITGGVDFDWAAKACWDILRS